MDQNEFKGLLEKVLDILSVKKIVSDKELKEELKELGDFQESDRI